MWQMGDKKLQSFEEIFGKIEDPKDKEQTGVTEIEIKKLVPFHNHPFKLYEGQRLDDMIISIKEMGVMVPIIVRKTDSDFYEILSGHNRVNAAKLAGLDKVPAVIKENLTDDEAMLIVTETNLMQRSFSDLLPSEKAKALKAHHDALSRQGARTDLINEIRNLVKVSEIKADKTCSQVGNKLKTIEIIGENYNLSKNSVARYIRLNYLIDPILNRVDDGEIAFIPAVSISYISEENQKIMNNFIDEHGFKIDMKKSELLKQYEEKDKLTEDTIYKILSGEISKTKKTKKASAFKIKSKIIQRFFTPEQKDSEIEQIIEKALEQYFQVESEGASQ